MVPLRATDFAGLGFTVAGTLRDGIYVKDLLNKGPAALSGNVKPGMRLFTSLSSHSNVKEIFEQLTCDVAVHENVLKKKKKKLVSLIICVFKV